MAKKKAPATRRVTKSAKTSVAKKSAAAKKTAVPKKAATKRAPAKKTATKKAATKKATAKKAVTKKVVTKKVVTKKAAPKKTPTKKTLVKKTPAKKTPAKKASTQKARPQKKVVKSRSRAKRSVGQGAALNLAQSRRALTLHKSISQIASIRLQAEILNLDITGKSKLAEQMRAGLDDIVDLTKTVQGALYELLQTESQPVK